MYPVPVSQQIHKTNSNTAVHIEDEIRLLAGGDFLNLQGVLQQRSLGEILQGKLLDERYPLVRIVDGLDSVSDAHDEPALLARLVDKFHRDEARIEGFGEHGGGAVQSSAESVALYKICHAAERSHRERTDGKTSAKEIKHRSTTIIRQKAVY
jgi:hypothetical protein